MLISTNPFDLFSSPPLPNIVIVIVVSRNYDKTNQIPRKTTGKFVQLLSHTKSETKGNNYKSKEESVYKQTKNELKYSQVCKAI